MCDKGFDGCDEDAFECSECDFRCANEDNIIEHSLIHTSSTSDATITAACGVLNALDNDKTSDCDKGFILDGEIKREYQKDISENINLTDQERMIKTETDLFADTYLVVRAQENSLCNDIKSEHMDINIEMKPDFLSLENHMNYNDKIKECTNTHFEKGKLSDIIKLYSEDGITAYAEDWITAYKSNVPRKNGHGKELDTNETTLFTPKQLEIEVESSGFYIPPCWKRQVLINTKLCDGNMEFDVFYLTDRGIVIKNKMEAFKYLKKYPYPNVDFQKLNFSVIEAKPLPFQLLLEFDVDNNGVYIPDGWKRKLKISRHSTGHQNRTIIKLIKYNIIYISPEGKRFSCKSEIEFYISKTYNVTNIDLERIDFSVKSPQSKAYDKIEIKIDNTGLYIPEGWQRKLYKYATGPLKGSHMIAYISPCGTCSLSKKQVYEFIKASNCAKKYPRLYDEKLDSNGIPDQIDVDKMDFSVPSFILKNEENQQCCSKVEIKVDNSGIYIPEGWQRKVYQYTNGKSEGLRFVAYISPDGKICSGKRDILSYNKRLERKGITQPVEIEKMSFSTSVHNLRKYTDNFNVPFQDYIF